jgi:hypothetical protein
MTRTRHGCSNSSVTSGTARFGSVAGKRIVALIGAIRRPLVPISDGERLERMQRMHTLTGFGRL